MSSLQTSVVRLVSIGALTAAFGALGQPQPAGPAEAPAATAPPADQPPPPEPAPAPAQTQAQPPVEAGAPARETPKLQPAKSAGGGPAAALSGLTAEAIDAAKLDPAKPVADQPALLVKLQVLLDRAHNSPGSVDGRAGPNFEKALAIFEGERHLPVGLNPQAVAALEAVGGGPIIGKYVITAADEAGPFIGHLPSDFYAQSKLRRMGYTTPEQEIAERYHMSPALIEALNPGADYGRAGTTLAVVRPHTGGLGAEVTRIEVDKTHDELLAFGADNKLVASFPSTIGSVDHPAPEGTYTVAVVRPDPSYVYDPKVLTWGPKDKGRFTIKPGPNNPTGVIWIGLSKPTYGIHGTPNAELIGKSSSHGCVRLTNWDAWDLGNAVKRGATVAFTGEGPAKA